MMNVNDYVKRLNILYEDNHLIVCEKFVNVLSQKDITGDVDMCEIVKAYIKEKYNKPGNVYLGLVHRLDRRVGGVMVFAKTSKAASRLSSAISNHEVVKKYMCICKGKLENSGNICLTIAKDEKNNVAYFSKDGKEAKLNYKLIGTKNNNSVVDVDLLTGRYNQIRFSFAYIKHPILNDYKYDKSCPVNNNELALWCYYLEIIHPVTKKKMVFKLLPKGLVWDEYKQMILEYK